MGEEAHGAAIPHFMPHFRNLFLHKIYGQYCPPTIRLFPFQCFRAFPGRPSLIACFIARLNFLLRYSVTKPPSAFATPQLSSPSSLSIYRIVSRSRMLYLIPGWPFSHLPYFLRFARNMSWNVLLILPPCLIANSPILTHGESVSFSTTRMSNNVIVIHTTSAPGRSRTCKLPKSR